MRVCACALSRAPLLSPDLTVAIGGLWLRRWWVPELWTGPVGELPGTLLGCRQGCCVVCGCAACPQRPGLKCPPAVCLRTSGLQREGQESGGRVRAARQGPDQRSSPGRSPAPEPGGRARSALPGPLGCFLPGSGAGPARCSAWVQVDSVGECGVACAAHCTGGRRGSAALLLFGALGVRLVPGQRLAWARGAVAVGACSRLVAGVPDRPGCGSDVAVAGVPTGQVAARP